MPTPSQPGTTRKPPPAAAEAAPPPGLAELAAGLEPLLAAWSGPKGATRGRRMFWRAWMAAAAIVLVFGAISIAARLHRAETSNLIDPLWRACTDEGSGAALILLAFPALQRMAQSFPPWDGRIGRFLGCHALGAAAFCALHVGGFVALRLTVYGLFGEIYPFGGISDFLDALPRDAVIYGLIEGGIWGLVILSLGEAPRPAAPRPTFDIPGGGDGAAPLRIPIEDILAVRSAGNYVEFMLRDGRSLTMRATLAQIAQRLSPHGLARTHKSWLVNRTHISHIDPTGAGDFTLTLPNDLEAPLSRRYRSTAAL